MSGGTYADRHAAAPAPLRWSHGARFRFARQLVEPHAGGRLLDFGCGDGTFLDAVRDLFPDALGAEVDAFLVDDANRRLGESGLRFVHTSALAAEPDGAFGVVTCMEVLEHCTDEVAGQVIETLHRLTARTGRLIVSVPVETGPALVAKQLVRALAAARGVEGYRDRERYGPGEMLRMVFAGSGTSIDRPVYEGRFADGAPNRYHGHKGFNWKRLRERLAERFVIESVRFSPVGWLPGGFNSQAWMTGVPR